MRLWAVCLLALLTVASAESPGTPKAGRILKVFHDVFPRKSASAVEREIGPNEVGKFKQLRREFAPKADGEYFTVLWKNLARHPQTNLTVTLYYRQARFPELQAATLTVSRPRRGTLCSEFAIVGEAFQQGGAVTAWKVVVSADGEEMDSFHSFLWKEPGS